MGLANFVAELWGDIGAFLRPKPRVPAPGFTPRLRQIFARARHEARQRGAPRIDAADLLLALARFEGAAGWSTLRRLGVDPSEVVRELESEGEAPTGLTDGKALAYSHNLKKCLAFAVREANTAGHRYV